MDFHILQSDELAKQFSLEGDRAVMREVLIDGPLIPEIGSDFEQLRARYFEQAYPEIRFDYFNQVAAQWHQALETKADRIYFWFDSDVFSQINLLFWLEWLYKHPTFTVGKNVFYIRPQKESFVAMSASDYFGCFNDAIPLGSVLLAPAHTCWRALASRDFTALEGAIKVIPQNHFALRSALNWYVKNYALHPKTGLPKLATELAGYYERNPQMAEYAVADKYRIFTQQHKKAGLPIHLFLRLLGS